MGVRHRHQQAAGLKIAQWMKKRPEIKRVMYPPLPDDPGHAVWKRDFTGACSLFGVVLNTSTEKAVSRMLDNYRLFKIGASWGGFESLVIPVDPAKAREAVPWTEKGYVLRYHIGLEDTDDLIADLKDGFDRLNQALGQG